MEKLDGLGVVQFLVCAAACDGMEKAWGFGASLAVCAASVILLAVCVTLAKRARG